MFIQCWWKYLSDRGAVKNEDKDLGMGIDTYLLYKNLLLLRITIVIVFLENFHNSQL